MPRDRWRSRLGLLVGLLLALSACLLAGWVCYAKVPARVPLGGMLELRGLATDEGVMETYVDAVGRLDESAQVWLAQSGLFLEDGRLDKMERLILRKLVGKKHQVWFLTAPRMLDGVGLTDMMYAWLWVEREDPLDRLIREVTRLAKSGEAGIPEDAAAGLRGLVARSRRDPELEIGLSLIWNLGLARAERFLYPIPAYNTELAMLAKLVAAGRPASHDRATLAAAIVYGSLFTAADAGLRRELPGYAAMMVDRAARDSRLCTTASVAAMQYLVWGAPATGYPQYAQYDGIDTDGWYPRLRRKPMTLKDFRWSFASEKLLDEISGRMAERGYGIEKLHDELGVVPRRDAAKWVVEYGGRRFRGSHVMNPAYYWERYTQGLTVPGDSLDRAQTEVLVARACGLPAVVGRLVIDRGIESQAFAAIYDTRSRRLVANWDDLDVSRRNRGVERIQVGFQKLPWDSFRFESESSGSMARIFNLETQEVRLLTGGIPAGYLLRGRNPELLVEYEY